MLTKVTSEPGILRSNIAAYVVLLASALYSLSCTGTGPARINLHLIGTSPDTDSVIVTFSLNGTPDKRSPYTFHKNTTYFGIDIPELMDTVSVSIAVETDNAECLIGAGQTQVTISGGQTYEGNITVNTMPKACPLTIKKSGDGTVQSDQTILDCGQSCKAKFAVGTPVALKAIPAIAGAPFQWGGTCSGGNSSCVVTVNSAVTASIDFTPRICTQAGFCWEYPRPLGTDLHGAWVAPDQSLYAVGSNGTLLHGNGITWTTIKTGTSQSLSGIWGSTSSDIWIVGSNPGNAGIIIHYDGQTATTITNPSTQKLNAIWGSAANDIYAVGDGGAILHYDGTSWSVNANVVETLYAIWGSGPKDIWAVGLGDWLVHTTGSGWSVIGAGLNKVPGRDRADYFSVWGTGPGDVWAAGSRLVRWNGSTWSATESGLPIPGVCRSVWGTGANTVWCGGSGRIYRWDGLQWSPSAELDANGNSLTVAGSGRTAWAVGSSGVIASLVNDTWKLNSSPSQRSFNSIWISDATNGWAVGLGGNVAQTQDGLTWTPRDVNTKEDLNAVWASGLDDVWIVGASGTILRFNGTSWSPIAPPGGLDLSATRLSSIYGTGPNDVWIVGTSTTNTSSIALHWDGNALKTAPTPPDGASSVVVYQGAPYIADGNGNGIYQLTGQAWNNVRSVKASQLATQGASLFAVGSDGISRYDGTNWSVDVTGERFSAIYARSQTDAWAWGGNQPAARLLRWNGVTWSEIERFSQPINGISGFGSSDTWVVGGGGSILHLRQ